MNKTEGISSDFILCIQKLLSSISTLRKHLSVTIHVQPTNSYEIDAASKRLRVSCWYIKI